MTIYGICLVILFSAIKRLVSTIEANHIESNSKSCKRIVVYADRSFNSTFLVCFWLCRLKLICCAL